MSQSASSASAPLSEQPAYNQKAIFYASMMTLVAAGIGFAIRNAILTDWGVQFGFTQHQLGDITGMGLAGFGLTIIFFSFFADILGYRTLLILAFALLLLSAVVTLSAGVVFHSAGENGKTAAYWTLWWGSLFFSLAQGLCEAAINPLTATLFPKQKTKYLNILHAGWPLGLMVGGILSSLFATASAKITHVRWEILASIYLLPTFYFGIAVIKNRFPISEAKAAGVNLASMIGAIAAPLLIFLFLIHGMVGYVELGVDSWIQNILGKTLGSNASLLFTYCSVVMIVLRLLAGPILHKLNPLGVLFCAATCGSIGLYFLGYPGLGAVIWVAATLFAVGKAFYWGTMLGVIGERFPRGGALAMGISGGIGMLSAGLLGAPGIGYTQDYFAKKDLTHVAPATYDRIKADEPSGFLFFPKVEGFNNQKVAVIDDGAKQLETDLKKAPDDKNLQDMNKWYVTQEAPHVKQDEAPVNAAVIYGGRQGLQVTALVPATMAASFLILVLYFMARGGYKAVHLDANGREYEVAKDPAEEAQFEALGTKEA